MPLQPQYFQGLLRERKKERQSKRELWNEKAIRKTFRYNVR